MYNTSFIAIIRLQTMTTFILNPDKKIVISEHMPEKNKMFK